MHSARFRTCIFEVQPTYAVKPWKLFGTVEKRQRTWVDSASQLRDRSLCTNNVRVNPRSQRTTLPEPHMWLTAEPHTAKPLFCLFPHYHGCRCHKEISVSIASIDNAPSTSVQHEHVCTVLNWYQGLDPMLFSILLIRDDRSACSPWHTPQCCSQFFSFVTITVHAVHDTPHNVLSSSHSWRSQCMQSMTHPTMLFSILLIRDDRSACSPWHTPQCCSQFFSFVTIAVHAVHDTPHNVVLNSSHSWRSQCMQSMTHPTMLFSILLIRDDRSACSPWHTTQCSQFFSFVTIAVHAVHDTPHNVSPFEKSFTLSE